MSSYLSKEYGRMRSAKGADVARFEGLALLLSRPARHTTSGTTDATPTQSEPISPRILHSSPTRCRLEELPRQLDSTAAGQSRGREPDWHGARSTKVGAGQLDSSSDPTVCTSVSELMQWCGVAMAALAPDALQTPAVSPNALALGSRSRFPGSSMSRAAWPRVLVGGPLNVADRTSGRVGLLVAAVGRDRGL